MKFKVSEFKRMIDRIPRDRKEIFDNLDHHLPINRWNLNAYYTGRTKTVPVKDSIMIFDFLVAKYNHLLKSEPLNFKEWSTPLEVTNAITNELSEKFKQPFH